MVVAERVSIQAPRILTPQAVAVACLAYVALAVVIAPSIYFEMLTTYTLRKYSLSVPVFALFGMAAAGIICRPSAPLSFIRDKLHGRSSGVLATVFLFILAAAAFSTLKHVTPNYVSFFADPPLARLDAALHFGDDPWRITHAVFPSPLVPVLFVLYGPVWFVQMVGMVLIAAFSDDRRRRAQYLLSLLLVAFVLGTVFRVAGSSAGPIFYDRLVGGDRFAELTAALDASAYGKGMLATSDYLFNSFSADQTVFGTGIAAMPSLHVAVALLNALFLAGINRILRLLGWFYFAAIAIGSVYFGWHYAVDSYVSIATVLLLWRWVSNAQLRSTSRHG